MLYREGLDECEVKEVIIDLNNIQIAAIHLDQVFWEKHFLKLVKRVRLKSSDFLILGYAYYYQPDLFVTFDKKLHNSYELIKNL